MALITSLEMYQYSEMSLSAPTSTSLRILRTRISQSRTQQFQRIAPPLLQVQLHTGSVTFLILFGVSVRRGYTKFSHTKKPRRAKSAPTYVLANGNHRSTALKKLFLDELVKRDMVTSRRLFTVEVSCGKKTLNVIILLIGSFKRALRANMATSQVKPLDLADTLNAGHRIVKSLLDTDTSNGTQITNQPSFKQASSVLNSTRTIQSKSDDILSKNCRMTLIFLIDKDCKRTFDGLWK